MGRLQVGARMAPMGLVNICLFSRSCENAAQGGNSSLGRESPAPAVVQKYFISKNWKQSNEPSRMGFLKMMLCLYNGLLYNSKTGVTANQRG